MINIEDFIARLEQISPMPDDKNITDTEPFEW
jgi:hypothetical protein